MSEANKIQIEQPLRSHYSCGARCGWRGIAFRAALALLSPRRDLTRSVKVTSLLTASCPTRVKVSTLTDTTYISETCCKHDVSTTVIVDEKRSYV